MVPGIPWPEAAVCVGSGAPCCRTRSLGLIVSWAAGKATPAQHKHTEREIVLSNDIPGFQIQWFERFRRTVRMRRRALFSWGFTNWRGSWGEDVWSSGWTVNPHRSCSRRFFVPQRFFDQPVNERSQPFTTMSALSGPRGAVLDSSKEDSTNGRAAPEFSGVKAKAAEAKRTVQTPKPVRTWETYRRWSNSSLEECCLQLLRNWLHHSGPHSLNYRPSGGMRAVPWLLLQVVGQRFVRSGPLFCLVSASVCDVVRGVRTPMKSMCVLIHAWANVSHSLIKLLKLDQTCTRIFNVSNYVYQGHRD